MLVGVEDIDVTGACRIRLFRHGADKRRVLDEAVDRQPLARLKVQPHVHDKSRIPPESFFLGPHQPQAYGFAAYCCAPTLALHWPPWFVSRCSGL